MRPARATGIVDHSAIWRVPAIEGLEAFKARFTRFSYARHSHETYAVGTVDQGAMRFWHKGTTHSAYAGTVIAINPGEVHDGRSGSPEGCRYRMLYIERAVIEELFSLDVPRIRRCCALGGPVLRDAQLARTVRRLHELLDCEGREAGEPLEQQSFLIQFLHVLFARHGAPPLGAPGAAGEKRCVERAKNYLAERLAEPVQLREVASAVGLTPFYFLRTFRRSTGLPPHRHLNQIRLERARAPLRQGERPADAAASGFVDQSHLTRRFKAAFGVTPAQYARAAGASGCQVETVDRDAPSFRPASRANGSTPSRQPTFTR